MKAIIATIFSALILSPAIAANSVYFSPRGNCEGRIVDRIDGAKSSIDAAVYSINNDAIVKALERAKERGVKIRILTDKTQAAGKSSKVPHLRTAGFNIRVHSRFRIEHNKFGIYDGAAVSTGSFNWTNPAEQKNSENCIFSEKEDGVVDDYQRRFDYLWHENTKKKSEKWFDQFFSRMISSALEMDNDTEMSPKPSE